jgi:hypothetical protein
LFPTKNKHLVPLDQFPCFFDDYEEGMQPGVFQSMKARKRHTWRTANPHLTPELIAAQERPGEICDWSDVIHQQLTMFTWVANGKTWVRHCVARGVKRFHFKLYV